MGLKEELDDLERTKNPQRRGKRFELFLAHLLEEEGFDVNSNPRTAAPRQTDLFAQRDQTYFIVEAKWLQKPSHVGHISAVRERLRRAPSDVFACVFSMSGYSSEAIEEVSRERSREMVLFDGEETRAFATGDLSFTKLLGEKRDALRTHAATPFFPWTPENRHRMHLRSGPDVIRLGEKTRNWLPCDTGDNDVVFSNEGLDFVGRYDGAAVSLDLLLDLQTTHDLQRVLGMVKKQIPLVDEGCFAIHQRNAGWFGFGVENFICAIENQGARYKELNWESYHHSEELAYVDRLQGGGLMCVTSRQDTRKPGFLHSSRMEIWTPGIPVEMSGIRRLCNLTGNAEAKLENIGEDPIKKLRFPERTEVEPIATIVSQSGGQEFASGLVIKNPFVKNAGVWGGPSESGEPFWLLSEHELLFCALRGWHNPNVRMEQYRLRFGEGCWIEHVPVFYILCDWV